MLSLFFYLRNKTLEFYLNRLCKILGLTSKLSGIFHAHRAETFPVKALIGKICQGLQEHSY